MTSLAEIPEHSFVSVLAVDVHDSTGHIADVGPDDAQALLDQCFQHARRAIEREGGMIIGYYGDGGIALFGWPKSVEDHAERACSAAWAIQASVLGSTRPTGKSGRAVQFRVGVHSGLVGLRRVELPLGSRLDTVGATVHFAAALQKSAPPDAVHISSHTADLCRMKLALEPQPDISALKTIHASVLRLLARPPLPVAQEFIERHRHITTIGREDEKRRLLEGRSVALIGEPGVGKSKLAAEAIAAAHERSERIIAYFGDSQQRSTAFSAMRKLLADAWNAGERYEPAAFEAATAGFGIDAAGTNALLSLLFPDFKPAVRTPPLTQLSLARTAALALGGFLDRDRVTILIEDLHLVDPESRQTLALLTRDRPKTSIVLTGRPEADEDARHIAATVIRLEPLPDRDMLALARLLRAGEQPVELLKRAVARADGIPFVLEQLMRSIGEQGASSPDLLPGGVESIIHSRLNRLSPGAKLSAQALSILGEDVSIDLAHKVLAQPDHELSNDLVELEQLAFVYPSDGRSVRFRHAILAEACATTVPRKRRTELHRSAIDAITSLQTKLDGQYERLAYHAQGAGDSTLAIENLWQASLEARRRSASQSIGQIFDRSMAIIQEIGTSADERFVDFSLMAFDSMQQLGRFKTMDRLLEKAIPIAQKQGRADRVCLAMCQRGTIFWFEARHDEGLAIMEPALAMAKQLKALPLIFSAQFTLASLLHGMGHMKRAIELLRELCALLSGDLETKRLGASGIPGSMVRGFLGWFMNETGEYDEGLVHADHALKIAIDEREPYSEVLARIGVGRTLVSLKRNADAAECLMVAHRLIDRNGYDAAMPHVTGLLATALARTGDADEAIRLVRNCVENGNIKRTGKLEVYYLKAGLAEALFRKDQHKTCFAELEAAIQVGRDCDNPCLILQGVSLRARLQAELDPRHPSIAIDVAERQSLAAKHDLVAWS